MILNPVVQSGGGSSDLYEIIKQEFLKSGQKFEIGTSALGRTLHAQRGSLSSGVANDIAGILLVPNPDYPGKLDNDEMILWSRMGAMDGTVGSSGDLVISESEITWYVNDPYVETAYILGFKDAYLQ